MINGEHFLQFLVVSTQKTIAVVITGKLLLLGESLTPKIIRYKLVIHKE